MVSRKLIQAHGRQCLGTSNATSKGSDYSFRPLTNSPKSVDPYPTRGSTPAAQYGKALGNAAAVPQQPRPNPDTTTRNRNGVVVVVWRYNSFMFGVTRIKGTGEASPVRGGDWAGFN